MAQQNNNLPSDSARELFFTLLRAGLNIWQSPVGPCNEQLWREVFGISSEQGVTAIVMDGIESLLESGELKREDAPSRGMKIQWAINSERIEQRYEQQRVVIGRMAAVLARRNIRMMILKGYGLSLDYPRPEHRPCGDIDIWMHGRQKEGDQLLHDEFGIDISEDAHHHTVFHIDGVMVENHYDFLNIQSHLSNRTVERELQRFAEEPAREVEVDGAKVEVASGNLHALFLLRHAATHFAAIEIGMRHVVDWALFVKHHHAEVEWPKIEAIARRTNMHRFLHCINAIAIDYFGIDPAVFPPFERNKELELRVLNDILNPEFSEKESKDFGFVRRIAFRTRRWWCNRWKHRMVYTDSLPLTFLVQVRSHLMKPKTLGLK